MAPAAKKAESVGEVRVVAIFTRAPTNEDLGLSAPDAPRGTFERSRVGEGKTMAVDLAGLQGSVQYNNSKRFFNKGFNIEESWERSILVQTQANHDALRSARLKLKSPLTKEILVPGSFGENLFLEGLSVDNTCIGDEFTCYRRGRPVALKLQVVSPRCPCAKVDMMLGGTFTIDGVRAHCAKTSLGGIFMRVIAPGNLEEGDILKLATRPHPTWTVARVANLLYGHPTAVMNYLQRSQTAYRDRVTDVIRREEWMGNEEELKELSSLPELAVVEFKEYIHKMLGLPGIGRYRSRNFILKYLGGSNMMALFLPPVLALVALGLFRLSRPKLQ